MIAVSISRCWQLNPTNSQKGLPACLRLVTTPVPLEPPDGWTAEQWAKLMSGNDGPWAAITNGHRVVSLAHCARLTDRAAEVGVQTSEDHRGCGLAAIAVNAWVDELAALGLILFYSADEDNIASHRVAQKCKATPLGHLIHITPAVAFD